MLGSNGTVRDHSLDLECLVELMSWVPSHQRKFSEAAKRVPVSGWEHVFRKEEAVQALLTLLRLPGGLGAAETICLKAGVRGPAEAIVRRAKAALRSAGLDDRRLPRRTWPERLSGVGAEFEASWLRWHAAAVGSDGASNGLTPNELGHVVQDAMGTGHVPAGEPGDEPPRDPSDRGEPRDEARVAEAETFRDLMDPLLRLLAAATEPDASVVSVLRVAADRLEGMAEEAASAMLREAERSRLRSELEAVSLEIGGLDGSLRIEAAAAMEGVPSECDGASQEQLEALLDAALSYAGAARAWRSAIDALAVTHDYDGAAALRSAEMDAMDLLRDGISSAKAAGVGARQLPPLRIDHTSAAAGGGPKGALARGEANAVAGVEGRAEPAADGMLHENLEGGAADGPVAPVDVQGDEPAPDGEVDVDGAAAASVGETSGIDASEDEAEASVAAAADGARSEPDWAPGGGMERQDVAFPIEERSLLADPDHPSGADGAESLATGARRACAVAFGQRRYGLAMHVARVAEAGGIPAPFRLPADLIEALVAGMSVGSPRSERAVDVFDLRRDAVVAATTDGSDPAHQLMAFAASLRPALFAVEAGANDLVSAAAGLSRLGQGVYALAGVAEAARAGDLVPGELAELKDHLAPQRQLRDLRAEMRRFYDDAQRRKIKFQRATKIWLDALRVGSLRDAIQAVIDNAPDAAELVSTALAGGLADVDRMVNAADREATAGRKMQVLTAGARATLKDWLRDVAERLRDWLSAHQAVHHRERNHHSVKVREELREAAEAAVRDLGAQDATGHPHLRIAVEAARDAVSSVVALFDRPEPLGLSLDMRLEDDLLLLPGTWRMTRLADWSEQSRSDFFDAVASLPEDGDFEDALGRAVAEGRFSHAFRARERVLLDDPSRREAIDLALTGEMDRQVEVERKRLRQVRKRLNDLLGADDRQILNRDLEPDLDKLGAMLAGAGDPQIDLSEWRARLTEIDGALDVAFRMLIGPLQARVDVLEKSGRLIDDLRKMVELKDLTTLAEHIEAYEAGVSPPVPPADLLETFSDAMLRADREWRVDLPSLQQAIAGRRAAPVADFSKFEEGQLQAAGQLLKAWRDLRSFQGRDASAPLASLFEELLTSAVSVRPARSAALPGLYELRTPVYSSRDECVAPAFGSAAEGRYDVILTDAHGISSGTELANLKSHCSASTFFVVRGRLDATARQAFMAQVRQRGADPACGLIDEAVVLFLATLPARRRSDLFAIALAMGVVQPYSDAPQQTSPEMFFGRVDELRELWDPNGSCLVYGGRQLGKTALLRQIELRHDRGEQIVLYGDQELEGFGDGRSATFWRWIARKVSARGVPIAGPSGRQSADGIRADIQVWLAEDSTRRLVFLIDEADAFLRREVRTGFTGASILVEVRELMRVTNRRCKFIFAGLHDVQRLARTPNSPLLHFGLPIRVGPLMGKDLFEARGMVEQPMATVGYAFGRDTQEGRALVGRALSEVGYYPSLMQTFGMVLVGRLNAKAASRISTPPLLPIRISEAELDEALEDNLFRENVRLKFDNTLNLDPRYRLIAYVVLLGTQESAYREEMRPGLSVAEIQRTAIYWWSQGFAEDPTNSAFEGLLREMEGLGVLVGLRDGRYAIRSARIAAMLGTLQQVEDRLIELAGQPYLMSEDTGGSRRLIGNGPSPLTFRQEGVLLERRGASPVALALTTEALGIDRMGDALNGVAEDQVFVVEKRIGSVVELERTISGVAGRMKAGQSGLLVARGPWLGSDAVAAAFAHAEVRRAQRNSNTGVRVILLPGMIDWNELETFDSGDPLWGATAVTLSTLQQGGLREWLARRTENNAPPVEMLERLRSATGGFPALLVNLQGRSVEALVASAEAAAMRLLEEGDGVFGRFGLDDGRLRSILRFVHEQVGGDVFDVDARQALIEMLEEDGARAPGRGLDVLVTIGAIDLIVADQQGWQINPLVRRILQGID
ncbi:hypothetical protein FHS96_005838 [Sphingomonas zeicaulis]|uniref:AAA family ATPase n=1 Tax=Sphingomonas zeicaulis TaxID=1632740 RepID=UPI003D1E7BAC